MISENNAEIEAALEKAASTCIALSERPTLYNRLAACEAMDSLQHWLAIREEEAGVVWRGFIQRDQRSAQ